MATLQRGLAKGIKLDYVPDTGNGKALQVHKAGYTTLSTGGAETRTLAIPKWVGQFLLISMIVDGGDCVITASVAINTTGNNTITFSAIGQYILLIGVPTASSGLIWRILGRDGAALSTVP